MIDVHKDMAKLSFVKFKAWHNKSVPNDTMSAEERYVKIGGKLPKQKKKED